ncbi:hypothetical protein CONCODRAFT_80505, partial [Conidiobolus coronatus NRRL 28638]
NKLKRFKLIEYYKNLILSNLSDASINNYELKLWKLGFYQPVELYRLLITKEGSSLSFQYCQFLTKSIGFYINLIGQIDSKLGLNLLDKVTNYDLSKLEVKDSIQTPIDMYFKSFIRIGDLSRYQLMETKSNWQIIIPDYYYHLALKLVKDQGHPYNQLGVLTGLKKDYLNSIHFYFRSLLIEVPFLTSLTNLKNLLEQINNEVNIVGNLPELEVFRLLVPKLIALAYCKPDTVKLSKLLSRLEICIESLLKNCTEEDFQELQNLLNFTTITLICSKEILLNNQKFYSELGSDQLDLILTTFSNQLMKLCLVNSTEQFKSLEKTPTLIKLTTPAVLIYSRWILDQFSKDTRQHNCLLNSCDNIFNYSNLFRDLKLDIKIKRPIELPELKDYKYLSIIDVLEGKTLDLSEPALTPIKKPIKNQETFRIIKLRKISKLLEVKQEQADDDLVFEDLSKNIEDHYKMDFSGDDLELDSQQTTPSQTLFGLGGFEEVEEDSDDEVLNIPNLSNTNNNANANSSGIGSGFSTAGGIRKGSTANVSSTSSFSLNQSIGVGVGVGDRLDDFGQTSPLLNSTSITNTSSASLYGLSGVASSHYMSTPATANSQSKVFNPTTISSHFSQTNQTPNTNATPFGQSRSKSITNFSNFFSASASNNGLNQQNQTSINNQGFGLLQGANSSGFDNSNGNSNNSGSSSGGLLGNRSSSIPATSASTTLGSSNQSQYQSLHHHNFNNYQFNNQFQHKDSIFSTSNASTNSSVNFNTGLSSQNLLLKGRAPPGLGQSNMSNFSHIVGAGSNSNGASGILSQNANNNNNSNGAIGNTSTNSLRFGRGVGAIGSVGDNSIGGVFDNTNNNNSECGANTFCIYLWY